MKPHDEQELELALSRHLSAKLDRHLGGSTRSFRRQMQLQRRRRLVGWFGSVAGGAAAAALLLVWLLRGPAVQPPAGVAPLASGIGSDPVELQRTISWFTADEGTVMVDPSTPARRIRQQVMERIEWYDPQSRQLVEIAVPLERVILINQMTY